jgi:hypothetical protein
MAKKQQDFVPVVTQHCGGSGEVRADMNDSCARGNGHGNGMYGNARGRGKHGFYKNKRGGREANTHYNVHEYNSNYYDHEYNNNGGPDAFAPNNPYGGLQVLPYTGLQAVPDGGLQSAPTAGYVQQPPSQSTYTEFNWQMPDSVVAFNQQVEPVGALAGPDASFGPQDARAGLVAGPNASYRGPLPMSMQKNGGFGNLDMSGARGGSYGNHVSPRQVTPVLHYSAPAMSPYQMTANNLGPSKLVDATPTPSEMPSMLNVPNGCVLGDSRSASVGARASTAPHGSNADKQRAETEITSTQNAGNQQHGRKGTSELLKNLNDNNKLQYLAALPTLSRADLMHPLADLRTTHLKQAAAIDTKRSAIYTALGPLLALEQDHEEQARQWQRKAVKCIELAVSHAPGDIKDQALMEAAKCMNSASLHSAKALEYYSRVTWNREGLERLNKDSLAELNRWYEGINREIVRALEPVLGSDGDAEERVREQKEWQERIDAEVASEKAGEEAERTYALLEKGTAVNMEKEVVDYAKVDMVDGGPVADIHTSSVIGVYGKAADKKGKKKGAGGIVKGMSESDDKGRRKSSVVNINGKTTNGKRQDGATVKANVVEGGALTDSRKTMAAEVKAMTADQTNTPDGHNSVFEGATAAISKSDNQPNNTGKSKKKRKNTYGWARKNKSGSVDSEASSSTTFNEPNKKPPEKKSSTDPSGSATDSKKKANGQGQGQGHSKVESGKE